MKRLILYQVDAFTKVKLQGNSAGVVVNADGLRDDEMQAIARELNNSETAFLFKPENNEYDVGIRYFTPTWEVPICGHASIASMYAKALEEDLNSGTLRFKTNIGILPFHIKKIDEDYEMTMTQGDFQLSPTLSEDITSRILKSLGLKKEDLNDSCPVQIASTGNSKVIIGVQSRQLLNALHPDFSSLAKLSEEHGSKGYFVFTFDSDQSDVLTYGRMFAPAIGINEDPVTGNANGPLGGYLIANNLVRFEGEDFVFKARQGEVLNRLGEVTVKVGIKDKQPKSILITGKAVVAFRTELEV